MVSDKVQIDTLSYKERCKNQLSGYVEGGTEFEITSFDERTTRGTTVITLYIR